MSKMNELDYANLTHEQWDKLFAQMNAEQIQEMLMDKNIISILINEDVSKSYPSITSLFERAKQLHVNDSHSYELFTNGYVAELLDKRLSEKNAYGKWDYEEKKYELLCNLPENIKWILGTPKYVDIFSKVSNYTATSVSRLASQPAKCGMYALLSDTKQKLTQDITESEIALENLKSSLAGEKADELADKLTDTINEKKRRLTTINENMEELPKEVKSELDKYGKLNHEEWDRLFEQMNEEEVKEALMNSAMIVSLINEDVTKTYPSINGLINRAHDLGIKDEKYFELFTSGYVAELLNKRLSDEKLEDPILYEQKKVELLNNLSVNVKTEIAVESSAINNQHQQTSILDLAQKEKIAMQAKQALSQITRTDFINEHRYDEKSIDELNKDLFALQQEIYGLSDDMALAMAKSCDRVKLEEERKNAYTNTKFEKEPYHRDQYVDLFDYLNSQISKEAENILLDDDMEQKLDVEESKKENVVKLAEGLANGTITARAEENLDFKEEIVPMDEATRVKNLSEELEKTDGKQYGYLTKDQVDEIIKKKNSEYSPKTQELLEESQEILNQPELSPDYSIDQNLEGYTKLEQEINNNPNLSEEQKQAMRNSLWTDFDNYVEHNPEQNKSR